MELPQLWELRLAVVGIACPVDRDALGKSLRGAALLRDNNADLEALAD